MFKNIENLNIQNIHKGTASKTHSTVVNRKSNSFILRTSGSIYFNFYDKTFTVNTGDIVFLPKGSSFEWSTAPDTQCDYVAIRFEGDLTDASPSFYPFGDFQNYDEFVNILPDLWKFGGKADHYRCYSVFYNMLAYLENLENISYASKKKTEIIAPAISYLRTHIYDQDLKIEILPKLCGVSGTYFRKLFQLNYSQSPQSYVLDKRLSHARTIIDTGDYSTITSIAAAIGYNDPLYFSRAFSKRYGVSPSEYAKNLKYN